MEREQTLKKEGHFFGRKEKNSRNLVFGMSILIAGVALQIVLVILLGFSFVESVVLFLVILISCGVIYAVAKTPESDSNNGLRLPKDVEREIEASFKKAESAKTEQIKSVNSSKNDTSDYVGSTQTMKYHTIDCRYAKGIKPKYRIENPNPTYFKKNKFRPCSVCLS